MEKGRIIARCTKCPREFVSLAEGVEHDPFLPQGVPGWSRDDAQPCGGKIERAAPR